MKWFRILLPILLIVGMLLCISPVAYAADPPDDEGGLNVDITVVGDNPDVDIDVQGEDAVVNLDTSGTEIYLSGQNINEPTVIRKTKYYPGVDKSARQQIDTLNAILQEHGGRLSLTMDGLAKLIIKVQEQDSALIYIFEGLDEHTARLDDIDGKVSGLNGQVSYLNGQVSDLNIRIWDLESRHNALATDVEEGQAAMLERLDKMELDYNRKLLIMAGVFLAVVLGLGIGLTRRIRRLRKRIS